MPAAKRTPKTAPTVGIGDLVTDLRAQLSAYRRTQIVRIAQLGGVAPSQIYAFRKGGPRSRVYMDTVTRIEAGLRLFVREAA